MTDSVTPFPAAHAHPRVREDQVHPDPLLDCLLEVCRAHGLAASRASLAAGLPLVQGRLSLDGAERAATRAGLAARLQRMPLSGIDPAALPAVAVLNDDKACVLVGRREGGGWDVLLPETGGGAAHFSDADLAARHSGLVLFVRPKFRFGSAGAASGASTGAATRAGNADHWFWGALRSQQGVYRDVLWAALLINLFALAIPLFSMNVYDRVVPNRAIETLWALAIGALLVISADLLMRSLRSHFVDEASARIDVRVSASLMERVLGMQLAHRPASVGSFASNLRGFEQVRDFVASSTVTALIDLPFALIFIAVLAWLSPWLVLPVVGAFVLILVVGHVLQHRLHELSQATWQAGAQRNATLIESLSCIETIKAQGAESVIQSRWERANAHIAAVNVRMRGLSSGAMSSTGWLGQVVNVVIIVVGVHLIGAGELSMGALIAAGMLSGRALAPAGQIVGLLLQYQGARTALESLEKVMATPVERPDGVNFLQRRELRGEIEFRNVRFAYPGRSDVALDGVSFKISAGERVALIGKVGCGKSTIQRLIMGLYQPTEGQVLIDGIDLRQLDPADVRRSVGYVAQDTTLFQGSLRENICFGLPHAEDASIVQAAELAGMADFVNRHPRGYDMPVGERGESLSGGQRQSVGVARAVLHQAPILLMDEPTSAMDYTTEAHVSARIGAFAQDKTMVLVTHRTTLLPLATRVIVVDHGKVMADGPREQILQALASGRITKAA
ncbi:MAG: ABC transporter [Methylibium sp. NZG]|nr:MAG: ABC transporter [Methylibium sp. NZG]